VEIARKADHIFSTMIKEAGLYDQVSRFTNENEFKLTLLS
jgi:GMP synthase PP-ATPase subunit